MGELRAFSRLLFAPVRVLVSWVDKVGTMTVGSMMVCRNPNLKHNFPLEWLIATSQHDQLQVLLKHSPRLDSYEDYGDANERQTDAWNPFVSAIVYNNATAVSLILAEAKRRGSDALAAVFASITLESTTRSILGLVSLNNNVHLLDTLIDAGVCPFGRWLEPVLPGGLLSEAPDDFVKSPRLLSDTLRYGTAGIVNALAKACPPSRWVEVFGSDKAASAAFWSLCGESLREAGLVLPQPSVKYRLAAHLMGLIGPHAAPYLLPSPISDGSAPLSTLLTACVSARLKTAGSGAAAAAAARIARELQMRWEASGGVLWAQIAISLCPMQPGTVLTTFDTALKYAAAAGSIGALTALTADEPPRAAPDAPPLSAADAALLTRMFPLADAVAAVEGGHASVFLTPDDAAAVEPVFRAVAAAALAREGVPRAAHTPERLRLALSVLFEGANLPFSPVVVALRTGRGALAAELVRCGAPVVGGAFTDGESLFVLAVAAGNSGEPGALAVARACAARFAEAGTLARELSYAPGTDGAPAFFAAAAHGMFSLAELYLDCGAGLFERDRQGRSALGRAVADCTLPVTDTCSRIMRRGGVMSPPMGSFSPWLDFRRAVRRPLGGGGGGDGGVCGAEWALRAALTAGVHALPFPSYKVPAFMRAFEYRAQKVFCYLCAEWVLRRMLRASPSDAAAALTPPAGMPTPLQAAVEGGHTRVAKLYVDSGARLRQCDAGVLGVAVARGMRGTAALLLAAGLPTDAAARDAVLSGGGDTGPLARTFLPNGQSLRFDTALARRLLDAGARVAEVPQLLARVAEERATHPRLPVALRMLLTAARAQLAPQ
jgi:hypothetical protein